MFIEKLSVQPIGVDFRKNGSSYRRLGRTDATKILKNNRKIESLQTRHIKQKPSETHQPIGVDFRKNGSSYRRLGRTDATKILKNNRKIESLQTRHIKQKPSETQRFCGFSDAKGMKLGVTTFLSVYDDLLDSMCLWNPASAFSVPFYPTYGTKLTSMGYFQFSPFYVLNGIVFSQQFDNSSRVCPSHPLRDLQRCQSFPIPNIRIGTFDE